MFAAGFEPDDPLHYGRITRRLRAEGRLIGTNDLCAEMGIAGQYGHEKVKAAYDACASAARNNGKHLGMGGVYDEELASGYIAMGARMILGGSDLAFLMQAAKARASFLRGLK